MARNTTTTKPASAKPASAKPASAKPASAKPARGKRASAKPAPVEPASVKPAPVEPVTHVNVRAAARAATRAAIDAAIAAGKTTVIQPYAADARGVGNKHRVYVEWCQRVNGERAFMVDVDGKPTLRTEPIDPSTSTNYADIMITANACGVKPDTIRGWVSHWLRHPACRPGGRANGIPKTMRLHRCDPQFHGGNVSAARAAMRAYVASDAKRVHDATPDA